MMNTPALIPMNPEDVSEAVDLIGRAMNPAEAKYARVTFERHFELYANGMEDGRSYFVIHDSGCIVGLTGLHHWAWGPEENVWLGWFAIEPERQGEGLGTELLQETEVLAREQGFQKLFVETYEHPDFIKALEFYRARGFNAAGGIKGWLIGGEAMIVLMKRL